MRPGWGVLGVVLAGLASGCSATGGGWITSAVNPLEKATFSLSATCKDTKQQGQQVAVIFDGHVTYHDQGADIAIHGDVEPFDFAELEGVTCEDLSGVQFPPGVAVVQGTYRSQSGEETGTFEVDVFDGGEPGPSNGDTFAIDLAGDIVHMNGGPVQGGNIQVRD